MSAKQMMTENKVIMSTVKFLFMKTANVEILKKSNSVNISSQKLASTRNG